MNSKYSKYVLPALVLLSLFPLFYFKLSFNNNDDQLMFIFANGVKEKLQNSNLILIHHFLANAIRKLFTIPFIHVNIYSLLLYTNLCSIVILINYLIVKHCNLKSLWESIVLIFILLSGMFFYFYLELEFVSISILSALSALIVLIVPGKRNLLLAILLFVIALLWRKESGIVFFIFSIPLWLLPDTDKRKLGIHLGLFLLCFIIIYFSDVLYSPYLENNTLEKVKALDFICARPTAYMENQMPASISLLQHWFCADEKFTNSSFLVEASKQFSIIYNPKFILSNIYNLLLNERYGFGIFILTFTAALLVSKNYRRYLTANLIILVGLFSYLCVYYRTPKRLILPILVISSITHIYIFLKSTTIKNNKYILFTILLFLSGIKLYKLHKLSNQHDFEHQQFEAINSATASFPQYLFIANPITIKLNYINSLMPADSIFSKQNVILYGWLNLSPDFKTFLSTYQLSNLTTDLIDRNDILFINEDLSFETAYINFFKENYNIQVEFQDVNLSSKIKTRQLVTKQNALEP